MTLWWWLHWESGGLTWHSRVPPWFYAAGERFIPGSFRWKFALLFEGSYTLVHHNNWLAGQIMFHSFGHEVHFHSQSKIFYVNLLLSRFGSYAHPTSRTWRCGCLITFTEQETKLSYSLKILTTLLCWTWKNPVLGSSLPTFSMPYSDVCLLTALGPPACTAHLKLHARKAPFQLESTSCFCPIACQWQATRITSFLQNT